MCKRPSMYRQCRNAQSMGSFNVSPGRKPATLPRKRTSSWRREITQLMKDFCVPSGKREEVLEKAEAMIADRSGESMTEEEKYNVAWRLAREYF